MLQLQKLLRFVEVVDAGNISRAADRVYLSQPALSRSLASLETELGAQLLQRGANGVALTGTGQEVYKFARSLLLIADAHMRLIDEAVAGESGAVTGAVGASIIGATPIVEALDRISRNLPAVRLSIDSSGSAVEQKSRVANGVSAFYFGLGSSEGGNEGLNIDVIGERRAVAIVREGHPLAQCSRIRPDDLAPYPIHANLPWPTLIRDRIQSEALRRKLEPRLLIDSTTTLAQLALRSDAVMIAAINRPPEGLVVVRFEEGLETRLVTQLVGYQNANGLMSQTSLRIYGELRSALEAMVTQGLQS
jgi:DNA-binding transcriptional LysR family regulator